MINIDIDSDGYDSIKVMRGMVNAMRDVADRVEAELIHHEALLNDADETYEEDLEDMWGDDYD